MNKTRNLLWTINTSISEGIYHNSSLGLISIKTEGHKGITLSDKNLGATVLWNDGDSYNRSRVGNRYQRGNDYGFLWESSGTPGYTTSQSYIGQDQYSVSTTPAYYNGNNCPYTGYYENLWGNNNNNKRGPCPEGYHIPATMELSYAFSSIIILGGGYSDIYKILHIPLSGVIVGTNRTDDVSALWSTGGLLKGYNTVYSGVVYDVFAQIGRIFLYPLMYIRPFKDNFVKPDNTRTRVL